MVCRDCLGEQCCSILHLKCGASLSNVPSYIAEVHLGADREKSTPIRSLALFLATERLAFCFATRAKLVVLLRCPAKDYRLLLEL